VVLAQKNNPQTYFYQDRIPERKKMSTGKEKIRSNKVFHHKKSG